MGEDRQERASRWEVVSGIVSAILVAFILGFLLHREYFVPRTPPQITLRADSVTRSGPSFLLHFTARNQGTETAAALQVRGELRRGGAALESSDAMLDYLPGGATRSGGLLFSRDPRGYTLDLRAVGYADP